jgi:hypothetical protein
MHANAGARLRAEINLLHPTLVSTYQGYSIAESSAAVFNGGGVAPVVIDVRGGVLQLEGDPGVRRRRSIEGKSSSEGRSPEGGGRRRSGRGSNGEGGGA